MRGVVLRGGRLRVEELPEPTPGPGEVLVEVLAAGICGSDLSCVSHGAGFNRAARASFGLDLIDVDRPLVLGHEFAARIVAYGPDTERRLPLGTRVVSMPLLPRDQQVLLGFAGVATPGAYAERMVLAEPLLVPVPDQVPDEIAALTEPMAVALHSLDRIDTAANDVPLVVGCGPIGLAVIALLKARDVGPIVAADLSPERRDLARRLGADLVVDPRVDSPYAAWGNAALTDQLHLRAPATAVAGQLPLRPTVAFECTGATGLLQELVGGSPPGTRIAVAGINLEPDVIEPAQAIIKELDLRFCLFYTPAEFAETLGMLAGGTLRAAPLITGRVGLDGVADAFERLASSPSDAKIIIDPAH